MVLFVKFGCEGWLLCIVFDTALLEYMVTLK